MKYKKIIIALTAMFAILVSGKLAYEVSADIFIGGPGPGSPTGNDTMRWTGFYTKGGSSWNDFVSKSFSSTKESTVISFLTGEGRGKNDHILSSSLTMDERKEIVNQCKKSEYIWYLAFGSSNYKKIAWSAKGSNNADWGMSRIVGRSADSWNKEFKSKAKDAAKVSGDFTNMWNSGHTILVCSYGMPKSPPKFTNEKRTRTGYYKWTTPGATLESINLTAIARDTVVELEYPNKGSAWSAADKTAYKNLRGGEDYISKIDSKSEEIHKAVTDIEKASSTWKTPEAAKTAWEAFSKEVKGYADEVKSPSVSLTKAQQDGLAKHGGVFTVSNYVTPYYIKGPTISGVNMIQDASCTYKLWDDGTETDEVCTKTGTAKVDKNGDAKITDKMKVTKYSRKAESFWQVLSATCNKVGLDAINADSNVSVSKYYNNGGGNGTIYTKLYDGTESKPFGPTGTHVPQRKIGFFEETSGCALTCALVNGSDNSYLAKDESGTKVTKGDGGKFTYFRDNEPHEITINQWEPVLGSNVDAKSKTSIRTIFNVIANGLSEFEIKVGSKIINGIGFSDANTKKFGAKSAWASNPGKDQNVDVAWAYRVQMGQYGLPKAFGSKPGAGGVVDLNTEISAYCSLGVPNADIENKPIRNLTPHGDSIWFSFVRAVGE